MLRDPSSAEIVAALALNSGARSRIGVLSHARHESLERAGNAVPTRIEETAASDVRDLAEQLTGTRPAIERVIIDLELRYGLDSSSFARTLGLSSERAQERLKTVTAVWAEQLDPAMMAWLGPGSCGDLESVLSSCSLWPHPSAAVFSANSPAELLRTGTDGVFVATTLDEEPTLEPLRVGDLLESVPLVLQHTRECDVCGERLRLLTPVRVLAGQIPLELVPTTVATAAHASRRRLPGALAPSIEASRFDARRARLVVAVAGAVLVTTGIGIAIVQKLGGPDETQADRVARLVESAPTSRLIATPAVMTPSTRTAVLANNGNDPILWHATTSAAWLSVVPTNGRLAPAQSTSVAITIKVAQSAPAKNEEALVTFTGSDGSSQTIRYRVDN